jgi:serine/threonine-protein kinase HipA
MIDALSVYLHDELVGTIVPVRGDPGVKPKDEAASNFFGGYAPEGNQRKAMADERGISEADLFSLLREFGGSIAGAVTLRDPDESKAYKPSYSRLELKTVAARLRQAVEKHDLGLQDDSRSMLPGFQPKLLLAKFDGEWFEPHGRAHSTHILKPELSKRPDVIDNEFYSHLLARHMGLATFDSEIVAIGSTRFLSIERYDRRIDAGEVSLIHQEDAAQALGLDWWDADAKFQDPKSPQREGRPSAAAVATLMASLATESNPVEVWLRQLTYHVLIGNNDAHAKNVGLLHTEEGVTITQLYDAVPNFSQEDRIEWKLAMAIGGEFDHRRISVEKIVAEATAWQAIAPARIGAVVTETLDAFALALESVEPPRAITQALVPRLWWNVNRLRKGFEISEPKPQRPSRN